MSYVVTAVQQWPLYSAGIISYAPGSNAGTIAAADTTAHAATRATVIPLRSHYNLEERMFRLIGCSGFLVPVGIKVRAKTQPNP